MPLLTSNLLLFTKIAKAAILVSSSRRRLCFFDGLSYLSSVLGEFPLLLVADVKRLWLQIYCQGCRVIFSSTRLSGKAAKPLHFYLI